MSLGELAQALATPAILEDRIAVELERLASDLPWPARCVECAVVAGLECLIMHRFL